MENGPSLTPSAILNFYGRK
ncbi:uncharacterized protein G2W53_031299 [Senna tora]|uniref:Uncharacterized protein n=1 Tax=Senna tora TaxID=362788 RepID=A0A834T8Z7_9FABA|nr:uncharacterized protein G2W53_031299 [Senna tora]